MGWSDLPEVLLVKIFELVVSIVDHYAFAGVCRSWRSVAQSEDARMSLANRPPLLLRPVGPSNLRLRPRLRLVSPIGEFPTSALPHLPSPAISHLLAYFVNRMLPARPPLSEFNCMLTPSTLSQPFLGYAHGHLMFLTRDRKVLIASVFTYRRQLLSPAVPRDAQGCNSGFLTAPPSSRGTSCSWLLLSGPGTGLLCWRVGSGEWLRPEKIVPPVKQVLSFRGELYALDSSETICIIRFSPHITVEPFEFQFVRGGIGIPCPLSSFGQQLVACGDKLLMVCSLEVGISSTILLVYCLDWKKADWVRVRSLPDWCLFLDFAGRCPVACSNPSRWGVLSNCIYVAQPGNDTWELYRVNTGNCFSPAPLCPELSVLPRWPSPIWVSPSMLT